MKQIYRLDPQILEDLQVQFVEHILKLVYVDFWKYRLKLQNLLSLRRLEEQLHRHRLEFVHKMENLLVNLFKKQIWYVCQRFVKNISLRTRSVGRLLDQLVQKAKPSNFLHKKKRKAKPNPIQVRKHQATFWSEN